jgi:hypothetical protein
MINLSRRKLIVSGLAATAGASGLAVGARLAQKYGLVPPDHGGIYGLGETLTYASHRLLTRHSLAREFPRSRISPRPFPNELAPLTEDFKRLQAGGFADWRLCVVFDRRLQELSISQPHHRTRVRRGLVLHRRVDRRASFPRLESRGGPPTSQIRCLRLDGTRHLGQHRYGRCPASPDISLLRHEWQRPSRAPRWTASHAAPSADRLQEHKIHHAPDGHRQSEKVWQRPRLRRCRGRLRLVHRHLTRPGLSRFDKT